MGMCSKCYKDKIAKDQSKAAPAAAPAAEAPQPMSVCPAPSPAPEPSSAAAPFTPSPVPELATSSASVGLKSEHAIAAVANSSACDAASAGEPARPIQTNTSRCWTCNKKIGLLGFQCKCDYFFCAGHRASDKHECSFDYKAMGKQQLMQANPTITPEKLQGF